MKLQKLCSDNDVFKTASLSESTASAMFKEGLGMSMAGQVLSSSDDNDAKRCASNMLYFLRNNFVKDKASGAYTWKQDQYYHDSNVNWYYLQRITTYVQKFFLRDGPCIEVKSPTYVFGDLHGNYKDLIRLSKMFGMYHNPRSSPAKFLFLGGNQKKR